MGGFRRTLNPKYVYTWLGLTRSPTSHSSTHGHFSSNLRVLNSIVFKNLAILHCICTKRLSFTSMLSWIRLVYFFKQQNVVSFVLPLEMYEENERPMLRPGRDFTFIRGYNTSVILVLKGRYCGAGMCTRDYIYRLSCWRVREVAGFNIMNENFELLWNSVKRYAT